MRNAFNSLDLDHPEKNPKSIFPLRNRNCTFEGMTIDKIMMLYVLGDIRDAIHTNAFIGEDNASFIIREPRVPAFLRTNIDDIHDGDDEDDACKQAHTEAVNRIRNSRIAIRETKYFLPPGVTIRSGPFSHHPRQVTKVFKEALMDFGEVGEDDLPVLHGKEWIVFVFAVNRPTDTQSNLVTTDMNDLANRFAKDLGM